MAEIKGKFITLAGLLMVDCPEILLQANASIEKEFGYDYSELAPDDFYETGIFDEFMKFYITTFPSNADDAYIYYGTRIFPMLKRTDSLPNNLSTPKDYIKFDCDFFIQNHRGEDIVPHKIVTESEQSVTIFAPSPGYNETIYTGIWLGALEMLKISSGNIKFLGGHTYRISW